MITPPFDQFGTDGYSMHFAHANGYPPGAYRALLEPLSETFAIEAMYFRPLHVGRSPSDLRSWRQLADDLIYFLDERQRGPVIGVGHSLGAVCTLLAAAKRPDLFSRLIIIEPVFLPPTVYYIAPFIPVSLRNYVVPPAKIARKRTFHWPSRQAAYDHLRKKRVFRRVPDPVFQNIIKEAIIEVNGGAALRYSREWEARTYSTPASPWRALRKVTLPVLALRGVDSDTVEDNSWQRWRRYQPQARMIQHEEAGHLLPFEYPEWTVAQIKAFLTEPDT